MATDEIEMRMANLSPWDRMTRMRKHGLCAGCHNTHVNSMTCGVRLEETFKQLMGISIPKGELKLCAACKQKMGHTHDLFKKLLLLKNVPLPDNSAARFLDVKTLTVKWLCNRCNKTCTNLGWHQRTCRRRNVQLEAEEFQAQKVTPPILVPITHRCEFCNRDFDKLASLKKHESTKGTQCSICKIVFCTRDQMTAHKRTEHGGAGRGSVDRGQPTLPKRRQSVRHVDVAIPAPAAPDSTEGLYRRASELIIREEPLDEDIYNRETPNIMDESVEDSRKRRNDEENPGPSKRPKGTSTQSIFAKRRPQQSEAFDERSAAECLGNLVEQHRRLTIDLPSTSRGERASLVGAASTPQLAQGLQIMDQFKKKMMAWLILNQASEAYGQQGGAEAEPTQHSASGATRAEGASAVGGQRDPIVAPPRNHVDLDLD